MKPELVRKGIKLAVLAQSDFDAFKQEVISLNLSKEDFQDVRQWFNQALQIMVAFGSVK